jgi:cell division protein FtsQ
VPARRRPTARAAVLSSERSLPELRVLLPSGRSLLIGLALIALAVGAYVGARETSVFAVRTLEVRGATPAVRAQVQAALAPELGRSLLRVDESELDQRLATIAGIHSFRFDRAFPHTLKLVVRGERPVLVLRQGSAAYLVSGSGRVLKTLTHPRLSSLPRLYVPAEGQVAVGRQLPAEATVPAVAVAALLGAPLPGGVRFVENGGRGLLLVLGSGFEVRLGDAGDLRLKLAIARRILHMTGAAAGSGYLDVSVPERPVLSSDSQVAG